MGVVADAVLAAGGKVVGVIPQSLVEHELAHRGLTELLIVGSMHERKACMAERADAFLSLPGGFGTLEEFCEVLTWGQLGLHAKPCGLLNTAGYFDALLAMFDRTVADRLLSTANRSMVLTANEPAQVLDLLTHYQPLPTEKWLDRSTT